jgi:uncharacterized protein YheU (UPF0270 family)
MTIIPPDQLQPDTLQALIEEFVTREGAVHGHADVSIDEQVETLLRQIRAGKAVIVFDEADESCTVISREQLSQLNATVPRVVEE